MSAYHLPPALVTARMAREAGTLPDPQHIWELAEHDADLMVHAMTEAGHIYPKGSGGEPFAVCPFCGWSPL